MNDLVQRSIGREVAIALAATKWWKNVSPRDAFWFQIQTKELCMDFGDFQLAGNAALGRTTWDVEYADPNRLWRELQERESKAVPQ